MAVRNPEDDASQAGSYKVIIGVEMFDRGISRINLVSYYLLLLTCKVCVKPQTRAFVCSELFSSLKGPNNPYDSIRIGSF